MPLQIFEMKGALLKQREG